MQPEFNPNPITVKVTPELLELLENGWSDVVSIKIDRSAFGYEMIAMRCEACTELHKAHGKEK